MRSFGGITFLLHQNETGRCFVLTHFLLFNSDDWYQRRNSDTKLK